MLLCYRSTVLCYAVVRYAILSQGMVWYGMLGVWYAMLSYGIVRYATVGVWYLGYPCGTYPYGMLGYTVGIYGYRLSSYSYSSATAVAQAGRQAADTTPPLLFLFHTCTP